MSFAYLCTTLAVHTGDGLCRAKGKEREGKKKSCIAEKRMEATSLNPRKECLILDNCDIAFIIYVPFSLLCHRPKDDILRFSDYGKSTVNFSLIYIYIIHL